VVSPMRWRVRLNTSRWPLAGIVKLSILGSVAVLGLWNLDCRDGQSSGISEVSPPPNFPYAASRVPHRAVRMR
jgi:hypothetical protein